MAKTPYEMFRTIYPEHDIRITSVRNVGTSQAIITAQFPDGKTEHFICSEHSVSAGYRTLDAAIADARQ